MGNYIRIAMRKNINFFLFGRFLNRMPFQTW